MGRTTDFLVNLRRIIKLHESVLKQIGERFGLSLTEAKIISFLHNNPGKDTAADIVELRMLSKGNVSQAVESLIQKSLLEREQDRDDRRKIHLFLTSKTKPITDCVDCLFQQFYKEMFDGFSDEERELFHKINNHIGQNTAIAMIRRGLQ